MDQLSYSDDGCIYFDGTIPNFQGDDEQHNVAQLTDWLMADAPYKSKLESYSYAELQPVPMVDFQESQELISMPNMSTDYLMNVSSVSSELTENLNEITSVAGGSHIPATVEFTDEPTIHSLESVQSVNVSSNYENSIANTPYFPSNEPVASCSGIVISIDATEEHKTQSSSGPVKRSRRRNKLPKKKLYEADPFDDVKLEEKRKNAVKARNNREKKSSEVNKLMQENNKLKSSIAEKDDLILKLNEDISNMKKAHDRYTSNLSDVKMMVDNMVSLSDIKCQI